MGHDYFFEGFLFLRIASIIEFSFFYKPLLSTYSGEKGSKSGKIGTSVTLMTFLHYADTSSPQHQRSSR